MDLTSRPLAAAGLISYRYRGAYGWVMIGAKDRADALCQAGRSCSNVVPENLEVWDGAAYVPALKARLPHETDQKQAVVHQQDKEEP